jgi:hypothetical protein
MSLRFTSQLMIDNLPDEQIENQFEVIMPLINIAPTKRTGVELYGKEPGLLDNNIYNYQPIVEEITFGHKNFQLDTRRVRTGWFGVPKDIERFHDVKITMFCPASMETQYYLEAWKKQIFNEEGEYYYPFSNYKKNIDVYMYGPGGSTVEALGWTTTCHLILQGCFPFAEKDWEFEYTDDPKRFRILATFNVDNIKVDTSVTRRAIWEGIVTSPSSLLDKALMGDSSTYSIGETYGGVTDGKGGSWIKSQAKNAVKKVIG